MFILNKTGQSGLLPLLDEENDELILFLSEAEKDVFAGNSDASPALTISSFSGA